MTARERFLLGGAGALAPAAVNLVLVDPHTVFSNVTGLVILGYALRDIVLFALGGFWAFLHQRVRDRWQLFQLGIVAPALIVGIVNGASASKAAAPAGHIPVAYAAPAVAPTPCPTALPRMTPLPETELEQIWRGFTGISSTAKWYVVVGFYPTIVDAQRQEQRAKAKGFRWAKVYCAPAKIQPDNPFAVVIATNVPYRAATAARSGAVRKGFPNTSILDVSSL